MAFRSFPLHFIFARDEKHSEDPTGASAALSISVISGILFNIFNIHDKVWSNSKKP